MKWIFAILVLCFSYACFAENDYSNCHQSLPDDHASFCSSFKSVAECHCVASGLPAGMCKDMNALYKRLISMFGSLQKICEYQHDTSVQTCMDDWNCYRLGGADSQGRLCSSTGNGCP